MGAIFFNSNYYYFSTWRPDTWISFCVSADDDGSYTTLVDGEVALEQDAAEYDMAHKKESGNVFLMNAIPLDYPYYGSILQTNHICASQHVRQNCFSEGRIDIAMCLIIQDHLFRRPRPHVTLLLAV